MASDSEKSSSNHNFDGSLKNTKNQGTTGNIGKINILIILQPLLFPIFTNHSYMIAAITLY